MLANARAAIKISRSAATPRRQLLANAAIAASPDVDVSVKKFRVAGRRASD
jgi:hypothetical protein